MPDRERITFLSGAMPLRFNEPVSYCPLSISLEEMVKSVANQGKLIPAVCLQTQPLTNKGEFKWQKIDRLPVAVT
jgi:hypothetical protein